MVHKSLVVQQRGVTAFEGISEQVEDFWRQKFFEPCRQISMPSWFCSRKTAFRSCRA
jgi:hypothetical protein